MNTMTKSKILSLILFRELSQNLHQVTLKNVPRLVSVKAEQSLKLVRRPKLYFGDYVRLARIDISFRKVHKQ